MTTLPKLPQSALQHHVTSLYLTGKLILDLYDFKLAQHKGWTSPPSKTVISSKALQHKLSVSKKTLQTGALITVFRRSDHWMFDVRLVCLPEVHKLESSRYLLIDQNE
ncbi:hypothetical protein ACTXT7_006120 [Hymenolepis weldensis]